MLTPHPLPVLWSRKSRAIPLLPQWVVWPVQSLSACTRVYFTLMNEFNLVTYINSLFTFFKWAYHIPIVFCRFSTWIALDDVDMCFSLILRKGLGGGESIL